MEEAENKRYAPPQAHVQDVPAAGGVQLGGRWMRLLATLIDAALLLGVMWAASVVTPWSPWREDTDERIGPALVDGVVTLGLFVALNIYLLARGQTIGKYLLGLRMTRSDGSRAGIARLVLMRYGITWLAGYLPYAGPFITLADALLIFRPSRKCLHDNIADTIVVKG